MKAISVSYKMQWDSQPGQWSSVGQASGTDSLASEAGPTIRPFTRHKWGTEEQGVPELETGDVDENCWE